MECLQIRHGPFCTERPILLSLPLSIACTAFLSLTGVGAMVKKFLSPSTCSACCSRSVASRGGIGNIPIRYRVGYRTCYCSRCHLRITHSSRICSLFLSDSILQHSLVSTVLLFKTCLENYSYLDRERGSVLVEQNLWKDIAYHFSVTTHINVFDSWRICVPSAFPELYLLWKFWALAHAQRAMKGLICALK